MGANERRKLKVTGVESLIKREGRKDGQKDRRKEGRKDRRKRNHKSSNWTEYIIE